MEKQNLPKLNNISYNKDVRIRLLKAKPYIGKNGQGEYRMWTFMDLDENETKVFFAPEDAHAVLQNLGEGSEVILRKVPLQDGSKISPKFELTVVNDSTLFSNINAAANDAIIGPGIEDFKRINFDIAMGRKGNWNMGPLYQAEILVKTVIPAKLITKIHPSYVVNLGPIDI